MEQLINLDKDLFVFLNVLGASPFDAFWKIITKQVYWAPFFIAVFYLIQRKIGWKNFGILLLFLAVLITFTDQMTNLSKNTFQRLRPCNDLEVNLIARIIEIRGSFSFFSGHASNSFASTMFVFLSIRKYYKKTYLLFFFPLLFAYSRIYLGLHFPGDILTGYLFGGLAGFAFYKMYEYVLKKYQFTKHE